MTNYDNYGWLYFRTEVEEPVALIEESKRFKKPSIIRIFANMATAQEELRRMADVLIKRNRIISVSLGRVLTWYRIRHNYEDAIVVRFVWAKFRLEPLSKLLKDDMIVRTDEELDDFLNR